MASIDNKWWICILVIFLDGNKYLNIIFDSLEMTTFKVKEIEIWFKVSSQVAVHIWLSL